MPTGNSQPNVPESAPADDAETTRDTLLDGRVTIVQPRQGYRAAIDPVLLAAAVPASGGDLVVDAGCGVGTAALCLAARVSGVRVIGFDKQESYAAWGRRGAELSGFADRVTILTGCLTAPPSPLADGLADHVMTNPPYIAAGHGRSPRADRAMATAESDVDLAAWIDACHRLLKPRGWLSLIHRADRLDDIIAVLKSRSGVRFDGRFGAIHVIPIYSRADSPARRVIIRARRDVRTPAMLHTGIVLHETSGDYTAAARRILEDGSPIIPIPA